MEVSVIAPNHSEDPLGSIFGPMGCHWVLKMGQNRKKLPCRKIRIFDFPAVTHFPQKNGSYGYSAKSWWGPPRVPLGANGVPLGRKTGQNRKTLQCLKIRIFDYPEVIDLSQKMEVTVMVPNHGGDPLGSDFGPMGSHWVEKLVKTVKHYNASKFEFSTTPRSSIFQKKMEVTVMAPNHGGDSLGSILGPMGSHWVEKFGQNRKNYHAAKFEFSTTPRSSIFRKKWKLRLSLQITVGPPRVHLGANGVPLGPKNGSKP